MNMQAASLRFSLPALHRSFAVMSGQWTNRVSSERGPAILPYAAIATRQYNPELFTRIVCLAFNPLTSSVSHDIIIEQDSQPQSPDSNLQP
jgi:hypothetical protein